MTKQFRQTVAVRNDQADAFRDALDAGTAFVIEFYDGVQPADPDTAITTQTLLARLTGSAISAPDASGGVLTFNAITPADAVATGTCSWFRMLTQTAGTAIADGSVGVTAGQFDAIFPTVAFEQDVEIGISTMTITWPVGP